jgi:hypothetical protein
MLQPRYLKRADLVSRPGDKAGKRPPTRGRYPWSSTTLWRKIRDGRFPPPIYIAGSPCWSVDALEAWEAEQRKEGGR